MMLHTPHLRLPPALFLCFVFLVLESIPSKTSFIAINAFVAAGNPQ